MGTATFVLWLLGLILLCAGCSPTVPETKPDVTQTLTPLGEQSIPRVSATPQHTPTEPIRLTPTPTPEPTPAVTLTIVYDNQAYEPELQGDWGFACLIERGTDTVLFDTGASGALLLDNLAHLGHTPHEIDAVILSHAHGDHTGGLTALLDAGAAPTVYLPATFPEAFKRQIEARVPLVQVSEPGEMRPGFFSTGPLGTAIPEQALAMQTPAGLVIVTGCAHPGVDLLAQQALVTTGNTEATLLLGGFHLSGASTQEVDRIITALQALGVQRVAPCHCTGTQAQRRFAAAYGTDYHSVGAGWTLTLTSEPEAGP